MNDPREAPEQPRSEWMPPWRSARHFRCAHCGQRAIYNMQVSTHVVEPEPNEWHAVGYVYPDNPFCESCYRRIAHDLIESDQDDVMLVSGEPIRWDWAAWFRCEAPLVSRAWWFFEKRRQE